jgi:hypothetical protein
MLVILMVIFLGGEAPQPIASFNDERRCLTAAAEFNKANSAKLTEDNAAGVCARVIHGESV